MEPASPAEIGLEVVAGLIAIARGRERVVDHLGRTVEAAVLELDPDGQRDRDPTWYHDLDPWVQLDPFDRMRKSYEDLMLLESQAGEIVNGLKSMLIPTVVAARRGVLTPRQAYDRLEWMAERREQTMTKLANAERRLREDDRHPGRVYLSRGTGASLRAALRELKREEIRGRQYRDQLGRLLTMTELIVTAS